MKHLATFAGSLFGLLLLAGCGGATADGGGPTGVVVDTINVKYGAPGLTVLIDGNTAANSMEYGKRTVFNLTAGTRKFEFRRSDKSAIDYTNTLTLAEGDHKVQIVTATGVISDTPVLIPTASECTIRFAAARDTTVKVDAYVTTGGDDLTLPVHKFSNIAFMDPIQEVKLDLGTYRVIVTEAGSTTPIADSGAVSIGGLTEALFVTQLGTTPGATGLKAYTSRP